MAGRIKGIVLLFVSMVFIAATIGSAQEIESLKGMKTVKAVFDVRIANPHSAALHIKLIHQSFQELEAAGKHPDFKVVFIGPAVKLLSTKRDGFGPDDQKDLDGIAEAVSDLSKDGVGLEICRVALSVAKVDPGTVLSEITGVENGWYSLIGYQSQGYLLVPNY